MEGPGPNFKDLIVDYDLSRVDGRRLLRKKRGITVWRMMILVAGAACAIWIIPPAYIIFDSMIGGPYLTSRSLRYQNLARTAGLLGRPESEIVSILGRPTQVIVRDPQSGGKTYVYAPVSYFPLGVVEVQCSRGVVISIDPWDD